MIKAFQSLHYWLHSNNIQPRGFKIVIQADPTTASHMAAVFGREMDAIHMEPPTGEPIWEGQICGVPFSIEPVQTPL